MKIGVCWLTHSKSMALCEDENDCESAHRCFGDQHSVCVYQLDIDCAQQNEGCDSN